MELLKWNLQIFAEEPATEGNEDNSGGEGNNGGEGTEPKGDDPKSEPKYTDEEVDKMIAEKFAKFKAKADKEKEEEAKKAKMNADQKRDYELEQIQKENAELKAKAEKIELGKTASGLLKESKIDATQDMLGFVVGDDEKSTKSNVDKFVSIINAQLKAAEVARATGTTPKSYDNQGNEMSEVQKRIAKYKKIER